MDVVIIDYGAGNVQSVKFAFNRLEVEPVLTNNKELIRNADKVIFPGVGHANFAMEQLQESGLDGVITSLKQPVLGICLGMQLMCKNTEEGNVDGLGIFDVNVKRFSDNVKVPKIGWNSIQARDSKLLEGVNNEYMYFVHSYYVEQCNETIAEVSYGLDYSASLQKDNFYACQFHPEKSGAAGELILKNFIEL